MTRSRTIHILAIKIMTGIQQCDIMVINGMASMIKAFIMVISFMARTLKAAMVERYLMGVVGSHVIPARLPRSIPSDFETMG